MKKIYIYIYQLLIYYYYEIIEVIPIKFVEKKKEPFNFFSDWEIIKIIFSLYMIIHTYIFFNTALKI